MAKIVQDESSHVTKMGDFMVYIATNTSVFLEGKVWSWRAWIWRDKYVDAMESLLHYPKGFLSSPYRTQYFWNPNLSLKISAARKKKREHKSLLDTCVLPLYFIKASMFHLPNKKNKISFLQNSKKLHILLRSSSFPVWSAFLRFILTVNFLELKSKGLYREFKINSVQNKITWIHCSEQEF